ncbi:MAG TPA: NUDIX pyrophosphatase [Bacteroidota bacterium]|nr:NUDIX pyrophosphatase [Bacteroidota bacterium]
MPSLECTIIEVCVFRYSGDEPEYLLLRRSISDRIYPDTWQIVSGSIEGGETALAASLRELKEETGFTPERYWVVPHMNTFMNARRDVVHISAVFAAQVPSGSTPVLSQEHYEYEWCSPRRAVELLVWPGQVQALSVVREYIVGKKIAGRLSEIPREQWKC